MKRVERVNESKQPKKIKLIIFDLDGTLLNIYNRYILSYIKAFEKMRIYGIEINRDKVIGMRRKGYSGLEIIRDITPYLEETKLIEINEIRKKIVNESELLSNDYPVNGLENFLEDLKKQDIKLAILTLRQIRDIELQLEKLSILDYFNKIIVKQNNNCLEEKRNGLIEILREFGIKPEETILVGDTPCDIEAGNKVGVITVGVLSGLSDENILKKENPNWILEDVTKLIPHI